MRRETISVHAGFASDPATKAISPPGIEHIEDIVVALDQALAAAAAQADPSAR